MTGTGHFYVELSNVSPRYMCVRDSRAFLKGESVTTSCYHQGGSEVARSGTIFHARWGGYRFYFLFTAPHLPYGTDHI